MRNPFRLTGIALVWLCGAVHAQERNVVPEEGGLRVINLVAAGEGNLQLTMDGATPPEWKDGFKLGDKTGGFKMKSGRLEFVLSKNGCKTARREVDVRPGKTITLVCYADPLRDDGGAIIEWELKVATLRQRSEPSGLFFTLVSFFEEEEVELQVVDSLSNEEQTVMAPKRRAVRVQVKQGLVNVRISHEGQTIKDLSTKRRGNYVVMLYVDADGGKKSVMFYDRKLALVN